MSTGLLLSGGIDSSAVAFWKHPAVCFTVNYGQRPAQAEITAARHVAEQIGSRHEILTIDCSSLVSGDLSTKPVLRVASTPEWWPFRNQLLITFCAVRALELDIRELMLGSVRSDAIHGDGKQEFFGAMRSALRCQEGALILSTPAISMDSHELVSASRIPFDSLLLTHSCHTGDLACGSCRGCRRRFVTFQELGLEAPDPAAQ